MELRDRLEQAAYTMERLSALVTVTGEHLEKTSRCSLDAKAVYAIAEALDRVSADLLEMYKAV